MVEGNPAESAAPSAARPAPNLAVAVTADNPASKNRPAKKNSLITSAKNILFWRIDAKIVARVRW